MHSVRIDELAWPDIEHLLSTGAVDAAVIAIGSTEQHGPHLPQGTDSFLADAIGEGLAKGLGRALLAPPICVGCSDEHIAFPGTISFRTETLAQIVSDYVASLVRHGFTNIVVVTAHGGNVPALAAMAPVLKSAYPKTNIIFQTEIKELSRTQVEASAEQGIGPEAAGIHAGEAETSLLLALRSELVRMDRAIVGYMGSAESLTPDSFVNGIQALDSNGVIGDPRSSTAEKGQVYLQKLVERLVEEVQKKLA
jgi:creatinine amidohydrolase